MGKIVVWNTNSNEDYSSEPYNFYIGRSKSMISPLANPYTHSGKRSSLAKLSFPTREMCLEAYEKYFDEMYGNDEEFTREFDRIYNAYKNGNDIYLQCFCKPLPCHGDIIARKLQEKLIRESKKSMKKEEDRKDETVSVFW